MKLHDWTFNCCRCLILSGGEKRFYTFLTPLQGWQRSHVVFTVYFMEISAESEKIIISIFLLRNFHLSIICTLAARTNRHKHTRFHTLFEVIPLMHNKQTYHNCLFPQVIVICDYKMKSVGVWPLHLKLFTLAILP